MAKDSSQRKETRKTVLVAMGANLSIFLVKLFGGLVSGSSALLSEAAHSLADTVDQVFLYTSLDFAERKPDEAHPFGYGKERFFWAFLAAVGIFVAGAGFSFYEGISTIFGPEESQDATGFYIAYGALGFALLAEGTSLVRALRQTRGEARERHRKFLDYVRSSREPTAKVVVFEDSAAVTGVLLALAGVGLNQATGNQIWQGIASLLIGVLLALVAFALGRDTKGLLIGEAALPEEREKMRKVIEERPEVERVLELLTMALGPNRLLVAVRFDLASNLSSDAVEEVSSQIDQQLREQVPAVEQVFLDATSRAEERERAPQAWA